MNIVRKCIFILFASLCCILTYLNTNRVSIEASPNIDLYNYTVPEWYTEVSSNVVLTNLNGLSNIDLNLKKDGYVVYNKTQTQNTVDISYVKAYCPSYRIYYEIDSGKLTIFSSSYESSNLGLAYIIDKQE